MRTTKAFIPAFRERGSGMFIAPTSIGGLVATRSLVLSQSPAYAALLGKAAAALNSPEQQQRGSTPEQIA